MFHLSTAERIDELALRLAEVLAPPLTDPMMPEWIVVGSAGTERWLRIELSRHLGASGPRRGDGVAANLELLYPGSLTSRILTPRPDDEPDPWQVDRLTWAVLDALHADLGDPELGSLTTLPPGGTWWARARRLADLFDRYVHHRPEMIRSWASGDDVDGIGNPIPDAATWQPHLWRLVRSRIGEPSSAEHRPAQLAALRGGDCPETVPARIMLFGLTTIPGGAAFLELLDALAVHRDVYLLLVEPSPGMVDQISAAQPSDRTAASVNTLLRSDDRSATAVSHPLLRSWARPSREAVALLSSGSTDRPHLAAARTRPSAPRDAGSGEPATLLAKIQSDLRTGTPPEGSFTPGRGDNSIRMHACHGSTRQVEVLRDQILHLLADDPTLTEDDIAVLCPRLTEFAPLIASVFGPSAEAGAVRAAPGTHAGRTGDAPDLAYRIADRSLQDACPLIGAATALVGLLGSRFSAAAVLDFASLAPVRRRFDFDDTAISTIETWLEETDMRWGLDGPQRSTWGIPAEYRAGSWQAVLDRLLMGVTVTDDLEALAIGDVLARGVEGNDVAILGRFADLVARLGELAVAVTRPHPADQWSALLRGACDELFAVDASMRWQEARLNNLLMSIVDNAVVSGAACTVDLTLADMAHLVGQHVSRSSGRPDFFRGGITVSSLTPLRGIPHRVICLLGMDDGAFSPEGIDGDDLAAANPFIGDRDQRADGRQTLLEIVLAAREHLIVLRTGHNVITNQPVPRAVPIAELRDTIASTLTAESCSEVMARLELEHPRQNFDERNFTTTAEHASDFDGPWSFNRSTRDGAAARASSRRHPTPFLPEPLPVDADTPPPVIDLAELREFLIHPVRYFVFRVLGISLPKPPERTNGKLIKPPGSASGLMSAAQGSDLLLELDPLQSWSLADRLLSDLRAGLDLDAFRRRELARSSLPPGRLADVALDAALQKVEPLVDAWHELVPSVDGALAPDQITEQPSTITVDVTVGSGARVVGSVRDDHGRRPGPIEVSPSSVAAKHRIAAWVDLVMLTASHPERQWWSVLVNSTKTGPRVATEALELAGVDAQDRQARAVEALSVAVDCFQRGRREPLPLFPKLSSALVDEERLNDAWAPFRGRGDGDDEWIVAAFGRLELDEVLEIEVAPGDPPGESSDRARRYADYLWGSMNQSLATADAQELDTALDPS